MGDFIVGWRGLDVWLVQLKSPLGGPYEITATRIVENQIVSIPLQDVYFGDVWLCAGQRNMAFTTNMVRAFFQQFPGKEFFKKGLLNLGKYNFKYNYNFFHFATFMNLNLICFEVRLR